MSQVSFFPSLGIPLLLEPLNACKRLSFSQVLLVAELPRLLIHGLVTPGTE